MINVIVTMKVKSGKMDDFVIVASKLASLVQAENGCLQYDYTINIESSLTSQKSYDSNQVILLERWESKSALDIHLQAPHMKKYRPTIKQCLEGPSEARVTRSISHG